MVMIGRFPAFGKRFFRRIRRFLGVGHFQHFWRLALAIACLPGRRSLSRLRRVCDNYRTRQAISHFLRHADWDAPEVLRQKALDTLRRLGYRPEHKLYAIFDDTQKRKRAKVMAAVSKIFLHAEKVYATGHTIVACCLFYRGVIIPYAVRLWANQGVCKESQQQRHEYDRITFVKLTNIVAEIVTDLQLPEGMEPIALFDSYYFCPAVVNACKARNWRFISVAKKNRNFSPGGRRWDKRKLNKYGPNVLRRQGKWLKVNKKQHRVVEKVGRMSKVGEVKVVFSQRRGESNWVALVTDELAWDAATILVHYPGRWPIELLFKMSKQNLGLGDYQVLGYRGVVRYLHLVMIAFLLLTHLALDDPDEQAKLKGAGSLRLPSVPQLQELLRQKLWLDTVAKHARGKHQRAFARKIETLIVF
jgi:hypothetical protein